MTMTDNAQPARRDGRLRFLGQRSATRKRSSSGVHQFAFAVLVSVLWVAMMLALRNIFPTNGDIAQSQVGWWAYIDQHGFRGIATIGPDTGANYTSIWYFVMWLFTKSGLYAHLPLEYCLKSLAIAGTIAAAVAAFFVVKTLEPRVGSWKPVVAASMIPFLPAFFLDTLKTNLPDSLYLGVDLFVLLAILRRKPLLAWFLLGIAVSLKLMAIYIAPFLIFLYILRFAATPLLKRLSPLCLVPGILVAGLPGILAGQTLVDATVGPMVLRAAGDGQGGLNYGIWQILFDPKWQWMPTIPTGVTPTAELHAGTSFGLLVVILAVTILTALLVRATDETRRCDAALDFLIVSPIICFLFLPSQHEGYWGLATVFAMVGFVMRRSPQSAVVLVGLSFILIEMYMGGRVLSPIAYEYLLVAFALYLTYRIVELTRPVGGNGSTQLERVVLQ
ncbi:MAG: hypothetical protein FWF36_08790 [Propionibacteriaceae bacterium]|nr:hypothetical protein [Propionibacteriaceae bacterium]